MVNALLVVGIIILIIGIVLAIWGAVKINDFDKAYTTGNPEDLTGWMLVVGGVIAIFTAFILFVASYYHGKLEVASGTKTTSVVTKQVKVE